VAEVILILLVPLLFGEQNKLALHHAFLQDWNIYVSGILLVN